jgi:hypothetical protein
MFREEVYQQIAKEFATGVGVATSIRVTEVAENPHVERSPEDRIRYRAAQDDWRVNRVICEAIRRGRYQELVRRVFWSRGKNPEWATRKHYTAAWTAMIGKPKRRTKTKSKTTPV